jgi:N utilization substance protein A
MVVTELRGEKVDIIPFSDDTRDFISKAMSPAKVTDVRLSEDGTQADVIVPDFQLSLAIGKMGVNANLAARLTGVRLDVKSETQAAEEAAGGYVAPVTESAPAANYAEGEWVTNETTGAMEWHAADGSVVSQEQWASASETGETAPNESEA